MKRTEEIAPATSYEELCKTVREFLPSMVSAHQKHELLEYIGDSLGGMGWLMFEESGDGKRNKYVRLPDGRVILFDRRSTDIHSVLFDMGVLEAQTFGKLLLSYLESCCDRRGREVETFTYSTFKNERLYVSSGPCKMVVAEIVDGIPVLRFEDNGFDDVLFKSGYCLAEWSPSEVLTCPTTLDIFCPCIEAPVEVQGYSAELQQGLFLAWLTAALIKPRELHVLVPYAQFSSGKSTFALAIARLFHGGREDIHPIGKGPADFAANACRKAVYAIDNLDTKDKNDWLEDLLATAVTGGRHSVRQLFTNGELYEASYIAALVITTRSAEFASRRDIRDRSLPIYLTPPGAFKNGRAMMEELLVRRNEVLSFLAAHAITVLTGTQRNEGISRFVEFEGYVRHYLKERTREAFECLKRVQQIAISEGDELLGGIVRHNQVLEGTPTRVVKQLEEAGYRMKFFGSGKAISNALKEVLPDLRAMGWAVATRTTSNSIRYTLTPPHTE